MDINRNNYQHYVTDWLDGTLAPDTREAFAAFLMIHSDIRQELEELSELGHLFQDPPSPERNFSSLKRSVNEKRVNAHNFLELVMAEMDGELDHNIAKDLQSWLEAHPEYKREADLFRATVLGPEDMEFTGKEDLKQVITTPQGEDLDALMIASLEGELTAGEQQKMDMLLATDAEKAKTFSLLSHTFLKPDISVVFPDKGMLKQRAVVPLFTSRNILRTLQVAASIALLTGVFLMQQPQGDWAIPTGGPELKIASQPTKPLPEHPETGASSENTGTIQSNISQQYYANITVAEVNPEPPSSAFETGLTHPRADAKTASAIPGYIQPGTVTLAEIHRYNNPALPPNINTDHTQPARLTIDEFSIEQIRYYTGGGNERPGFLADISVTDLLRSARPYDRINNAGQKLYARWVQLKERAFDEVMPYR
jgi:hypothetical protein